MRVSLAWNKSSLLDAIHRKSLYHSLCMELECWWNCKIHFVLTMQTEQWTRARLKSVDNTTQKWTHFDDNGKYASSLNGANWKNSHYNPIQASKLWEGPISILDFIHLCIMFIKITAAILLTIKKNSSTF